MRFWILPVALLCFVAGCGDNIAPVSGRVTLDNKPLPNANVIFMPDATVKNPGQGSRAKTNANGEFTLLQMTNDVRGAVIGKHSVSITAFDGDDGAIPSSSGLEKNVFRKPIVPERYNSKTELTFEVPPGGSTSANFDLKSDPVK
jgi:hypothetical protein